MDWFLYDRNLHHVRVNLIYEIISKLITMIPDQQQWLILVSFLLALNLFSHSDIFRGIKSEH